LHVALGKPAWATISAHGLSCIELPREVRSVIVGADNDRSGAGQDAALKCRRKLEREGRKVRVIFPPTQGQDWLDVLREGSAA
jgi:putative DNA primase/helicase